MDTKPMILTVLFFAILILVTVILSYDRKMNTDSIEAFIRIEVARQLKEQPPPPTFHGKYLDVQVNGNAVIKEGK